MRLLKIQGSVVHFTQLVRMLGFAVDFSSIHSSSGDAVPIEIVESFDGSGHIERVVLDSLCADADVV